VAVNAARGAQLRARAVVLDQSETSEQTRATVQTPVDNGTLVTTVTASADPVQPGDLVRVSVIVTNTSPSVTENNLQVKVQIPRWTTYIAAARISAGGTCTDFSYCNVGDTVRWLTIPSLGPGESTVQDLLWLDPIVHASAPPGFLMFYETQTLIGDEAADQRVVAGTTIAVEPAP
jgi:hypothetical protein